MKRVLDVEDAEEFIYQKILWKNIKNEIMIQLYVDFVSNNFGSIRIENIMNKNII